MKQIGVSFEDKEIVEITKFANSKSLSNSSAIRMLSIEAIEARRVHK